MNMILCPSQPPLPSSQPLTPPTPSTPFTPTPSSSQPKSPSSPYSSSPMKDDDDIIPGTPPLPSQQIQFDAKQHEELIQKKNEEAQRIVDEYKRQLIQNALDAKKDEKEKENDEKDVSFITGTNLKFMKIYELVEQFISCSEVLFKYTDYPDYDVKEVHISGHDLFDHSKYLYTLLIAFPLQILSMFDQSFKKRNEEKKKEEKED